MAHDKTAVQYPVKHSSILCYPRYNAALKLLLKYCRSNST
jgi:hypothetical protein